MKKLEKISRNNVTTNVKDNQHPNFKYVTFHYKGKYGENTTKASHECGGFVHIRVEYTNFLRKKKKGYNTIFMMMNHMQKVKSSKPTVWLHSQLE